MKKNNMNLVHTMYDYMYLLRYVNTPWVRLELIRKEGYRLALLDENNQLITLEELH